MLTHHLYAQSKPVSPGCVSKKGIINTKLVIFEGGCKFLGVILSILHFFPRFFGRREGHY